MSFDDIASIYDETRTIPNWILNKFYQRIFKEIRLNPNLNILDAGVGTGRTVEPLLDLGVQLVGIDISKKMLEKMVERVKEKPERNQVNLIRGDVTYLPFRPHAFDMVISIHVLHLLKKWKQAVLETKRVLKPKGSFIVADHNAPELENELGKKYLELDANTIKKRSGLKNLSTKLDISNTMCLAKEFFEHKRIKLLNCMLEKVRERNYWQSYLKRKASSIETYVILWKEIISVSKIVDLLDKRFSSLEEGLSTETYGKIKMELAKWRIEKTKTNPFLEIRREFNFTMVQF